MANKAWFNARVAAARGPAAVAALMYMGRRLQRDGLTLDANAQLVCDTVNSLRTKTLWETSPQLARTQFERVIDLFGEAPQPVERVEDRTIAGPAGDTTVRLYTPAASQSPLPIFVYYHGGGFVQGSLRSYDSTCRHLANATGAIVVEPDYRLAPEGRFPAAVEDCLAATKWAAAHAVEFGGDPDRLVVGGDSAGGNLTAVITQECRDGGGPKIAYQVLIYPMLDWSCGTKSFDLFGAAGLFLTQERITWYARHLFNEEFESEDVRASPGKVEDLSNLPPALVITAGFDPLRDEGRQYADRLKEASVNVEFVEYEGMVHGFAFMAGAFPQGAELLDRIGISTRAIVGD
jgi:acetyl esterase